MARIKIEDLQAAEKELTAREMGQVAGGSLHVSYTSSTSKQKVGEYTFLIGYQAQRRGWTTTYVPIYGKKTVYNVFKDTWRQYSGSDFAGRQFLGQQIV